jgi:hypothetical protein
VFLASSGGKDTVFVLTNNVFTVTNSGLSGDTVGAGTIALNTYAYLWDFRGNAMAGNDQYAAQYPAGNYFPPSLSAVPSGLGADLLLLNQALSGVFP